MTGKNLGKIFSRIDKRDPNSKLSSTKYSVFISIAQQLNKLRTELGLSQRALASLANTSQPNIDRWETPGCTAYSLSKLVEVADALGADVELRLQRRDALKHWHQPDIKLGVELKVQRRDTLKHWHQPDIKLGVEIQKYENKLKGVKSDSTHMVGTF